MSSICKSVNLWTHSQRWWVIHAGTDVTNGRIQVWLLSEQNTVSILCQGLGERLDMFGPSDASRQSPNHLTSVPVYIICLPEPDLQFLSRVLHLIFGGSLPVGLIHSGLVLFLLCFVMNILHQEARPYVLHPVNGDPDVEIPSNQSD